MRQLLSEVKFRIFIRRLKIFWQDFTNVKLGLIGVAIIIFYLLMALVGPMVSPYKPKEKELAMPMAMPEWMRFFPQYHDLPSTEEHKINFTLLEQKNFINVEFKNYDQELCSLLNKTTIRLWNIIFHGGTNPQEIIMIWNFTYDYIPPPIIHFRFRWRVINLYDLTYNIELCLVRWGNMTAEYSIWDSNFRAGSPLRSLQYRSRIIEWPQLVDLSSSYNDFIKRLSLEIGVPENQTSRYILKTIFSEKGKYGIVMHIRLKPLSTNATCKIQIIDPTFKWLGLVHGVLGTDHEGADILSQLIYGSSVSLSIGLMIAMLSTTIGTTVGIVTGYIGGWTDEAIMRIVDVLFCLPTIPLLLTLITMFGRNIYLIMFLITLLSWMGLSRSIRSQVLSLREMAFVEAARCSGASRSRILSRHILPNVMPLAFTSMTVSVPAAIIMETSLSFLGFGDPNLVTWGRIINQAVNFGAFPNLAWWWILAPAMAITFLCVGFVLISHALDQVLNPRLRKRKF